MVGSTVSTTLALIGALALIVGALLGGRLLATPAAPALAETAPADVAPIRAELPSSPPARARLPPRR